MSDETDMGHTRSTRGVLPVKRLDTRILNPKLEKMYYSIQTN